MNWFELIGRFMVDCGTQLLPTINAGAYLAMGAFIYHVGIMTGGKR